MSLCATTEDLRRQFAPKGFDTKDRAVPSGYTAVPAGEDVQTGDIFWSRKWQQWTYGCAGLPAVSGMYFRKATV